MTPERYRQIGELYHAALETDADQRAGFLEAACGGDVALRREVESLIASNEGAADFIAVPALAFAAELLAGSEPGALPGQTIAHYRVESLLGAGGMGRVYLAEDTRLGRRVALKLLPEYFTHEEKRVQRFRQEARAASALNHPNIVTIHEIGQTESVHFIATEFIDGETLREHMAIRRMTVSEVLDVATQVASALQAAHEAGIVHRDIKPENIMLRRDGIAKVLDFGLAKLALSEPPATSMVETTPGVVMGTVGYMSPEQARGQHVDARADIWSVGVVLYEMLTRRLPFAGETPSDVVAAILKTEPAPLVRDAPDVPDELQRIAHKCLAKDREERYRTAKELLSDLRQLQKRLEVAAEIQRSTAPKIGTPATAETTRASTGPTLAGSIAGRRRIALAVLLLLIALTSLFVYRRWRTAGTRIDSLAVMPFVNDGQDAQSDYLSDGITESLISRLSQSPNLKVMSRNSVFRFKGRAVDARQISEALGVHAVMMGHLKRIDDQLVINAELIDARDGSVIWTRQYIRGMADFVALQSDVAHDITDSLRVKLSGAQQEQLTRRDTDNVEAYELYLKGRYFWNRNQRTPEDFRKSREYYQRAIDLDPNFALAYVGLADIYGQESVYSEVPSKETYPKAKAATMKALQLDDSLGEAHATLGWIKMVYERDQPGAERELRRAIEMNPNYALAHHRYGAHLTALGRFDEAIAKRKAALELDPLSAPLRAAFGWTLYFARRYDDAIKECREALALEENFFRAHLYLGLAYEQKGMTQQALAEFNEALRLSEGNAETLASKAYLDAASGNRREAQQILSKLNEISGQKHVDPYFLALIHVGLGEKDQAFEQLEKALEDRSIMFLWFKIEPRLDSIRSDPRYDDLLRRVGLPR